jgi:hypothetical protein
VDPQDAAAPPLEQVWPVQRSEKPAPAPRQGPKPIDDPAEVLPDRPVRPFRERSTTEDEPVREILREVDPGQSSAAKIETLMPRLPRPQNAPAPRSEGVQRVQRREPGEIEMIETEIGALPSDLWTLLGQPVPGTAPDAPQGGPPTQGVARAPSETTPDPKAAGASPPATPQAERAGGAPETTRATAALTREPATTASGPAVIPGTQPAVQRLPEARSPVSDRARETVTDRPVGAPSVERRESNGAEAAAAPRPWGGDAALQEAIARAEAPAPRPAEAPAAALPVASPAAPAQPLVQRVVEIPEVTSRVEGGQRDEPADAGSGAAAEPDIDKLAREVYRELKRRLDVERERGRGRFS